MKYLIPTLIAATALTFSCSSPAASEAATEEDHSEHMHTEEATGPEMHATPEGAKVFFANLTDGDTVQSPLYVEFGIEGMEVMPAGEIVEGAGHHHIIIDAQHIGLTEPVPADETNIHYGKGQTSDSLSLSVGKHNLTLQFADGVHRSYGEKLSNQISIFVAE
mgnify:CR=1 FL=1